MDETLVCRFDGVPVAHAKTGRLVHLDEAPEGHEIRVVSREEYESAVATRAEQIRVVEELVEHHTQFHPESDCPWSKRALEVIR